MGSLKESEEQTRKSLEFCTKQSISGNSGNSSKDQEIRELVPDGNEDLFGNWSLPCMPVKCLLAAGMVQVGPGTTHTVADLDGIQVVLILQIHRIQELWPLPP